MLVLGHTLVTDDMAKEHHQTYPLQPATSPVYFLYCFWPRSESRFRSHV